MGLLRYMWILRPCSSARSFLIGIDFCCRISCHPVKADLSEECSLFWRVSLAKEARLRKE